MANNIAEYLILMVKINPVKKAEANILKVKISTVKMEEAILKENFKLVELKLVRKNKELIEKNNEVVQKDKELVEKNKEVMEKKKELVEKNKQLMQKDKELVEKNKELVEKNKEMEEKNKGLMQKDKELVEKNKDLVQKDKEMVDKNLEVMGKNKELVEKNKEVVEKNKDLEEKHNLLLAELRGKVECPVCLVPPTKGPMASCPKGHLVCLPCHQKMFSQKLMNCPNCREPMGNTMSLLAKTVIENIEHECTNNGCDKKLSHKEVVKHKEELCQYRRVLCPGNSRLCEAILPFWELDNHFKICLSVDRFNQGNTCSLFLKKSVLSGESLDGSNGLTTDIFNLNNEVFAVQKKMENSNFSFGVLMLAEKEKCNQFKVTIEIQDANCETAFLAQFNPTPIDMENRDLASLVVPKQRFASMITSENDQIKYKLVIKVSEKRAIS